MIILGVDPGSRKIGHAYLRVDGSKISYLSSGILVVEHLSFLDRLGAIHRLTSELLESNPFPDEVAVESLIYVKSPTALMKLAQARGAVLAGLSERLQGKIFEYAPNLVKSMTTGFGHADKKSVDKFVSMMFGKRQFKTSDESDAVAIALCHALCRNSNWNSKSPIPGRKSSKRSGRSLTQSLLHGLKEKSL